ncbi:MAG TPA: hypothetical protein VHF69_02885 [Candidatus Synoicihabitans sp.]|nr:hypothetical protein [Candidatus Synoicihabitans sp.]
MKSSLTMMLLVIIAVAIFTSGCSSAARRARPLSPRFHLEVRPGQPAIVAELPQSETRIRIGARPVLTEYDFADVAVAEVELGRGLLFQFTPTASTALYRLTATNLGQRLVLYIGGRPVGARVIDTVLSDGALLVLIERPEPELDRLVSGIRQELAIVSRELARR